MSIPKIIHFIAPKDQSRWHPIWHRCFESWQNHFSDFEMKVWGDDNREVEQLIETYYPQYLSSFRAFPYDVMRWNFSRFVLLHHYGGIYADMDIFCYQNFCEELEKHNLFLIENILAETVNGEFPFEICLMASKANHPYYKDCMDNSVEQYRTIGHLFDKDSIDDEWLIVTLTDSIAIQSRNIHDPAQISLLPYYLYNNRAASYNKSFYTKHMRSSAWNYSFLPDKYLIIDNLMFAISSQDDSVAKLIAKQKKYQIIDIEDFDFYKDYSNDNYFTGNQQYDHELKIKTKSLYKKVMGIS